MSQNMMNTLLRGRNAARRQVQGGDFGSAVEVWEAWEQAVQAEYRGTPNQKRGVFIPFEDEE